MKCWVFFLLFYNTLDLNNQKVLCLPSIFQFERTVTDLNRLNLQLINWDTFNSVFNNYQSFYCCHLCIAPSRLVLNSDPHFAARQMWAFTVVRVTTAAVYNFINGATLFLFSISYSAFWPIYHVLCSGKFISDTTKGTFFSISK